MNAKLIEASIGMLARMVPPETWAQVVGEINALVSYAKSADERLTRIEKLVERVEFLEAIVRNNVDGAGAAFGEREMFLANGGAAIREALAPSKSGAING